MDLNKGETDISIMVLLSVIKHLTFSHRVKKIQMDNGQWCMKEWCILKIGNAR